MDHYTVRIPLYHRGLDHWCQTSSPHWINQYTRQISARFVCETSFFVILTTKPDQQQSRHDDVVDVCCCRAAVSVTAFQLSLLFLAACNATILSRKATDAASMAVGRRHLDVNNHHEDFFDRR
jgi:hypothetical protein